MESSFLINGGAPEENTVCDNSVVGEAKNFTVKVAGDLRFIVNGFRADLAGKDKPSGYLEGLQAAACD
ncbi:MULTISPECIES: hypothetical protein [unclassified Rhizobium]|uniref:hypothetical protein n=1 Tax=unclassified Rhizobium TaxID=2613769 RepID=UPI001AEA3D5B|nr:MULTISPECIES: hypothetical protein [unclassified Rhizobium]MBP2463815.1 hypothetical protein [Rhizobium sp. PvP014]MBP2532041.1 hypothetical protein [Rhizobium sp. PvP099]